jgi:hypothetical protein
MQFPFANRRTPIQKTDGAESYRVPDRRRLRKLVETWGSPGPLKHG